MAAALKKPQDGPGQDSGTWVEEKHLERKYGQKMRTGDFRQGVSIKCDGGNAHGAFLHWKLS